MPAKKASPSKPPARRAPAKTTPASPVTTTDRATAKAPKRGATPVPRTVAADTSAPAAARHSPALAVPFTGWRVPVPSISLPALPSISLPSLPQIPDSITLPVTGSEVNATERESVAYYAVLGGLVAVEVIEWPIAVLFFAGHFLARQHRFRALAGAAEALEEA